MFSKAAKVPRAPGAQGQDLTVPMGPEEALLMIAQMDLATLLKDLETSRDGLTNVEAAHRLQKAGPNVVSFKKAPSWWLLLFMVIPNPFNILLCCLAVISVASPDRNWKTFGVLVAMILISSAVRFVQEYKSITSATKLQNSIVNTVKVRRRQHDKPHTPIGSDTPEENIVVGDVLLLGPGDTVVADCMILEANYLRVSQSSMSGESVPVTKSPRSAAMDEKHDGSLFDTTNIALMGSNVVSGRAVALVLRTGDDCYIASIIKKLSAARGLNAFQKGIRDVSYMLVGFMLVMVPIVLGISGSVSGDWSQAAVFSLSVAVGLVPEMLPAIVNANLARGAHLLSKKKAIVKRLDAVQNIGAMTVLCSDKTGTLTKDQVHLQGYTDCTGLPHTDVFQLAYINAICQENQGNTMDAAIIHHQEEADVPVTIPHYTKFAVIPFNFERRRSSCLVKGYTECNLLICKGAFDEVLALCNQIRRNGKDEPLDATNRYALSQRVNKLAENGLRVLLVAKKQVSTNDIEAADSIEDLETAMVLDGLLTFMDPAREDALESVTSLRAAGVDIKILTGDNIAVAINVCRQIGLVSDLDSDDVQAITGPDLALLEGQAFDEMIARAKVFAKLTPTQKSQVVERLKKAGHCVGMLGDGVNDCVAIRAADVGISVDSGSRAAKDEADVILTKKGLNVIVEAVRIGRITHGNSIKYIKMVASSNFGNVFSILIASSWLPFTPMSSIQLLVQNLLYDISQIAIPWDRMDEEYLQEPKRWASLDLLRFIAVFGPTSSVIDLSTFCIGRYFYGIGSTSDNVPLFQTHWFLQGLMTQTIIVHLLRTAKIPIYQSRAARSLVIATCAILLIGFCIPYIPPIRDALGMTRPADTFVGILAALLATYCIEVQVVKMIYIRLFKKWL
jgi:Mg2+-importing ATPase